MKKHITIVCFCISVVFLAQATPVAKGKIEGTNGSKIGDNNKNETNSETYPNVEEKALFLDENKNKGNSIKTKISDISKENKSKEAKKDIRKNPVKKKETIKLRKADNVSSSSNDAKKATNTLKKEKTTSIKTNSKLADELKKQLEILSKEKKKDKNQIRKLSSDVEKAKKTNEAEKARTERKFLLGLFITFLWVTMWLYYFIKNKRLKTKMNHQKLSLKEVIKKQELLFNQFIEFSKKNLNVDDLERKIQFVNPTSEKSVVKSEKDSYLEFIARIKNNLAILSKGIQETGKELKEKDEALALLKEKIQEPNISENYLKLGQEKQELEKQNRALKQQFSDLEKDKKSIIPSYSIPSDTYITSNLLVSAGPRKEKDNDTELGEDTSGIYNTPYGTYFWILDGTSDSGRIELEKSHVFSSRVLSQQLGNALYTVVSGKEYEKSGNGDTLKRILDAAITITKATIIDIVENAPYEIHQQILDHIHNNQKPYCSTTILFGFLDKNGNLWHIYLGDSQVHSFTITDGGFILHKQDENEGKGRFFLSMNKSNEEKIIFETNNFEEKVITIAKMEAVDYVIAFSDGIGSSEKALSVNPKQVLSKISFTNQKSYDDKSLVILERKYFK